MLHMHFTDTAIVLSARRHAETSAIVRVLMREHGVYAGVVRGASGKAARGLWQAGNIVLVTWNARLPEHMGMFTGELVEPVAAHVLPDAARLAALTSAATLLEMLSAERHTYPQLYATLLHLAMTLKTGDGWQEAYCRFELELLASLGFRLDLGRCAATGKTDELIYVSPKSGRAVCAAAGEPYREKMLKLPRFLCHPAEGRGPDAAMQRHGNNAEILDSLRLTGYFLGHWLMAPHEKRMPAARSRLVALLQAEAVEA